MKSAAANFDKPAIAEKKTSWWPLWSYFTWIFLCCAAGIAALLMGRDFLGVQVGVVVASLPAMIGLTLTAINRTSFSRGMLVFSWTALAVAGVAGTGGGLSPLTILFAIAPLTALLMDESRLALEAAVFAIIGYVASAGVVALGMLPQVTGPLASVAGLGALIGLFQVGFLVAGIGAQRTSAAKSQLYTAASASTWSDAPVVVIDINRDNVVKRIDGDVVRILGAQPADILGRGIMSLATGDTATQLRRALKAEEPFVFRPRWNHGRRVRMTVSPAKMGHRIALTDASQPNPEIDALKTERDAAVAARSDMARVVASLGHELRTPITAMRGFAELIKERVFGEVDEKHVEHAHLIEQGSQHLLLLVDDLLDTARNDLGKLTVELSETDVRETARDAIALLAPQAETEGVTLRLLDGPEAWANADPKALRQIWLNLISNAIKFSPRDATVRIGIDAVSNGLRLFVSDQGRGLSEKDVETITEPFRQGENSRGKVGIGLGLSIVKTYAELMGGRFHIACPDNKGTVAMVMLPAIGSPDDRR